MTDVETIARLQRTMDDHGKRMQKIELEWAASSERWKMASEDIHAIKEELKDQGQAQNKRFNVIAMGVVLTVLGAFMKWVIDGGLSGYQ